jgi:hypothetical protein
MMVPERVCETSFYFDRMEELAAHAVLLTFVASKVLEIRLLIIIFVPQFLLLEGRRRSHAAWAKPLCRVL